MADEPDSITGPKNRPTRSVPWRWMANRPTRMATVSGTTYGVKPGVATLEPLDRAEHRDGRRDHAVAVEQRGAEDAQQHQRASARAPAWLARRQQRGQREDAALAVVVGAHDEREVLDRDDQHQRPEDERQDAEHVRLGRRDRVRSEEALAHRVERAGADVAVDDAERAEGQRQRGGVDRRRDTRVQASETARAGAPVCGRWR